VNCTPSFIYIFFCRWTRAFWRVRCSSSVCSFCSCSPLPFPTPFRAGLSIFSSTANAPKPFRLFRKQASLPALLRRTSQILFFFTSQYGPIFCLWFFHLCSGYHLPIVDSPLGIKAGVSFADHPFVAEPWDDSFPSCTLCWLLVCPHLNRHS